ncbi:MAG: hypothetical protein OEY49_14315, partial [Candidatus Heimdallarchaeota archaeon]|nr:hypothetical protein [Candidatus Heimdallarchaeota archaeon]
MTLKEKTDYLPFLITKNEAEQIFYQWLKTKYRRKKNLTTTYQIQSLAANYIPVYLITADASAHYGGTKTISKFNTESEEYEYDYIHLSDQVEIKIIYEMIYAISHTQILKLTNIQRFDFDELEELSDMSEDNFIEFDLSKEGAIDLFNELVKTYLHDKAISEVVDDGESLRIDLNPPKIKFE